MRASSRFRLITLVCGFDDLYSGEYMETFKVSLKVVFLTS